MPADMLLFCTGFAPRERTAIIEGCQHQEGRFFKARFYFKLNRLFMNTDNLKKPSQVILPVTCQNIRYKFKLNFFSFFDSLKHNSLVKVKFKWHLPVYPLIASEDNERVYHQVILSILLLSNKLYWRLKCINCHYPQPDEKIITCSKPAILSLKPAAIQSFLS